MNMAPDLDFLLRALLPRAEEGGVEDGGHLLRRDRCGLRCHDAPNATTEVADVLRRVTPPPRRFAGGAPACSPWCRTCFESFDQPRRP